MYAAASGDTLTASVHAVDIIVAWPPTLCSAALAMQGAAFFIHANLHDEFSNAVLYALCFLAMPDTGVAVLLCPCAGVGREDAQFDLTTLCLYALHLCTLFWRACSF